MSDSRLEKFIYAICSMNVSDLPVPLSRIEKLWNCLITGETPDFEPLSRNEKYLMAMLDRYDISNLPAPMSRGEKLLYKIAVGETDLSDVPGHLSRYEELLKYLIENSGISGGDFEYVLYTLNQSLSTLYSTAEKPVKSAILKGQTLVNLFNKSQDSYTIEPDKNIMFKSDLYKTSTTYLIKFDVVSSNTNNKLMLQYYLNGKWLVNYGLDIKLGINKFIITSTSNQFDTIRLYYNPSYGSENVELKDIMLIEYQEDMENWDIPYFEGMQSVKMPVLTSSGKNLFNVEMEQGSVNTNIGTLIETMSAVRSKDFIKLPSNETFTISKSNGTQIITVAIYDKNYKFVRALWEQTFTLSGDEMHVKIADAENDLNNQYQIEKGKTPTSYEPYKTNILSTSEDVELRGIGRGSNRVEDELDCLTGEVTERIGEYQITGEENWDFIPSARRLQIQNPKFIPNIECGAFACDKLQAKQMNDNSLHVTNGTYYIGCTRDNWLRIILDENLTSLEQGKEWLKANKPIIQYQLKTESIKTVDLTVVNQDNQPTQLGTFENVTHVSLVAENLIPEVEMEVASHISEELASASPLMDDISTEQQQLETTVDKQSENVDVTMIATTEIFEEIL